MRLRGRFRGVVSWTGGRRGIGREREAARERSSESREGSAGHRSLRAAGLARPCRAFGRVPARGIQPTPTHDLARSYGVRPSDQAAERSLAEEHFRHLEQLGSTVLSFGGGLRQRHRTHRRRARPPSVRTRRPRPGRPPRARTGAEHAVARGGRAAALDVAEHGRAGLHAGALLDLLATRRSRVSSARGRTRRASPSSLSSLGRAPRSPRATTTRKFLPRRAAPFVRRRRRRRRPAARGSGSSRHRRRSRSSARSSPRAGPSSRRRSSGCGTRRSSARGRSPRSRPDGGVEAEGVVGAVEVVVDRLRHADDRQPFSAKSLAATPSVSSPPIATSASSCDRRSSARLSTPPVELVRVRPRGADDRAAARQDPARSRRSRAAELPSTIPRQPSRTPTPRGRAPEPPADRADHRVEAGAVAAAGEDSDLHAFSLAQPLVCVANLGNKSRRPQ